MKTAICHYTFHRRFKDENWSLERFVSEVKALGVTGIDFHARFVGPPGGAAERISAALKGSGLILSSFSLSTDFNRPDRQAFDAHVKETALWLDVAAQLKAPACRIFGGHIDPPVRRDAVQLRAAWQRMIEGVAAMAKEAEKRGLLLALENHGGLPCTGEEQVEAIKTINSPALRGTVDVGNYLAGGQEGHVGTALAAPYAAYVHFKDSKKKLDTTTPWGWSFDPCVLGEGDVDLPACLAALHKTGYNGFVGLEYEGAESEVTGVPRSVKLLKTLVQ
jgi:sugar phosphate isomerase/epimerase